MAKGGPMNFGKIFEACACFRLMREFASQDGFDIHVDENVTIDYDCNGASVLTIRHATGHEDGWFQCTAINSAGICTTRARVRVIKPPEIQAFKQDFQLKIKKSGKVIQAP